MCNSGSTMAHSDLRLSRNISKDFSDVVEGSFIEPGQHLDEEFAIFVVVH
jgi:hypothetical protein